MLSKLKSRKFWLGLVGAVSPIALQAMTGQVGWVPAAGMSTAAIVTYVLAQAHVDASTAKAIGALSEQGATTAIEHLKTKGS